MCNELYKKPFIAVAHRGGGKEAPENTIAGIAYGIEVGVDMAEIDVRATKDNELIVLHDEDFKRVAGVEKRARELSFASIREQIKIEGEPVATLAEVLKFVQGKIGLLVEIKEPDTTPLIVQTLQKYEATQWCCLISFYPEALQIAKRLDPSITTGLDYMQLPHTIDKAKKMGIKLLLPQFRLITKEFVQKAHKEELVVGAWSVDAIEDIEKMYANGVDIILSDYPSMLVAIKKSLLENTTY